MRALRKLVLGETWALPIGIAVAVAIAGVLRVVAGPGGWWEQAGGFVLLALLVAAFAVAVVPRR
ncbi:MAG: hypothetical protein QOD44_71 [Solirubrobacteraceae bacterium]|jgi:membrane protein implicated in regulation of membrane protease activity|nr:hypothetical protein [Solirubrobacteraceae bacterium]